MTVPRTVRMDAALLERLTNGRLLFLHDSYLLDHVDNMWQSVLRTWAFPNGLRAVSGGSKANINSLFRTLSPGNETGSNSFQINATGGAAPGGGGNEPYEVTYPETTQAGDGNALYHTLPLNDMTQIRFDAASGGYNGSSQGYLTGTSGALFSVTLQNSLIEDGVNGGLGVGGASPSDIRFRMLMYSPSDSDLWYAPNSAHEGKLDARLNTANGVSLGTCVPAEEARQSLVLGNPDTLGADAPSSGGVCASWFSGNPLSIAGDLSHRVVGANTNDRTIWIEDYNRVNNDDVDEQEDKFLINAGWVAYVAGQSTGVYVQRLGDNSWSYEGFATAEAPEYPNDFKRVVSGHAKAYMDSSTVDKTQAPLIVLACATEEGQTQAQYEAIFNALVTKWDNICIQLGLPDPHYLFWHMYRCSDTTDHETAGLAMAAVAQNHERCHFVSTYAITNGTLFEDSGEEDQGATWIEANGYATRTSPGAGVTYGSLNGDLTGDDGLHPNGTAASDFFAEVTWDEMWTTLTKNLRAPRTRGRDGRHRGSPSSARAGRR